MPQWSVWYFWHFHDKATVLQDLTKRHSERKIKQASFRATNNNFFSVDLQERFFERSENANQK